MSIFKRAPAIEVGILVHLWLHFCIIAVDIQRMGLSPPPPPEVDISLKYPLFDHFGMSGFKTELVFLTPMRGGGG